MLHGLIGEAIFSRILMLLTGTSNQCSAWPPGHGIRTTGVALAGASPVVL
jgi:hypothetical protein